MQTTLFVRVTARHPLLHLVVPSSSPGTIVRENGGARWLLTLSVPMFRKTYRVTFQIHYGEKGVLHKAYGLSPENYGIVYRMTKSNG